MTTHSLQPVDNAVHGRLALVTGATLAISFLPVHAPEQKHPDTNLPCNINSGGIGSACAKALAVEGCDVVLHYSSSQEKADTLVNELQRLHPKQLFSTARADLSSREATRLLVPDVLSNPAISARHKAISILVANAGTGRRIRDIKDIEEDDWDLTLEINARSQFVVTKACLPGMRGQGWGRVILVGSIASRGGGINGCHYAASKGAMT
ncbi:3-oxoacyl-[acyl-carrier-protein] reductase FabG [Metarhizium anisopliae]|nr:3-oxoacyl-[acyl-carrier-protein] reductase FabG [Metarhizium anisopliae]